MPTGRILTIGNPNPVHKGFKDPDTRILSPEIRKRFCVVNTGNNMSTELTWSFRQAVFRRLYSAG